jgi:hypothetical protein
MQGNRGATGQKTLVRTFTKISSNKSRRQGDYCGISKCKLRELSSITNNKPDIIIRDNEKRTCMLIDVAIPGDRNVIKQETKRF